MEPCILVQRAKRFAKPTISRNTRGGISTVSSTTVSSEHAFRASSAPSTAFNALTCPGCQATPGINPFATPGINPFATPGINPFATRTIDPPPLGFAAKTSPGRHLRRWRRRGRRLSYRLGWRGGCEWQPTRMPRASAVTTQPSANAV